MRIHHLNCATMRPFAFVLSDTATLVSRAHLVVHCLLVETNDGLVLVDSGFGCADRTRPSRFERAFMALSNSSRDLAETAAHQVAGLGYALEDVRHIVQTHLHDEILVHSARKFTTKTPRHEAEQRWGLLRQKRSQ